MTLHASTSHVAAIVVAYHPEQDQLRNLVALLREQCLVTVIVDNGGGRECFPGQAADGCVIREMGVNVGLGAAIGVGVDIARTYNATHVITFDQDSEPAPDMVQGLFDEFERQVRSGVPVGAVGPVFVDHRGPRPVHHPFLRVRGMKVSRCYCADNAEAVAADYLITSGCLTSFSVLDAVGTPSSTYFVDFTDLEWCFRARGRGYQIFGVCGASMRHELGEGLTRRFLGVTLIAYGPKRRYYFARNTILIARLGYVPLGWKLRLLGALVVRCLTLPWAPRNSTSAFWLEGRMMMLGVLHGASGVRGELPVSKQRR